MRKDLKNAVLKFEEVLLYTPLLVNYVYNIRGKPIACIDSFYYAITRCLNCSGLTEYDRLKTLYTVHSEYY